MGILSRNKVKVPSGREWACSPYTPPPNWHSLFHTKETAVHLKIGHSVRYLCQLANLLLFRLTSGFSHTLSFHSLFSYLCLLQSLTLAPGHDSVCSPATLPCRIALPLYTVTWSCLQFIQSCCLYFVASTSYSLFFLSWNHRKLCIQIVMIFQMRSVLK